MSDARKIIHNTLIQSVAKVINTLLAVIAFGMMTRYLGAAGFGSFTAITAFLQFAGIIADMGLSLIAIQMMTEQKDDKGATFSNIVTFRIITAAIILGIAPCVSIFFPYPPIVKIGIAAMAASYFFSSITQLFTVPFQIKLKMHLPSLADLISRVVLLAGTMLCIWLDAGIFSLIALITLTNIVQLGFLWWWSRTIAPLSLQYNRAIWKKIFHRSWPIALSIVFNLVYLRADTIILSLTRSATETGLYGAAYRIIDVLASFPIMFMGITLSRFADAWEQKDKERFGRYFQKSFDAMLLVATPLTVGAWFLADDIMALIAGEDFRGAGTTLRILTGAASFVFLGSLFAHLVNVINKQRVMMWGYAAIAVVGLAGYWVLIPRFGPLAAAWMTLGTEAIIAIIAGTIVIRTTKNPVIPRTMPKIALATLCMGVFLWGMGHPPVYAALKILSIPTVIFSLCGANIIYGTACWYLGLIPKETFLRK